MKVRCINNEFAGSELTIGKEYEVIAVDSISNIFWYIPLNDKGVGHNYSKSMFEPVNNGKDDLNIQPENLLKTYNEGCSDVKKVLKNLYPDFEFEKALKIGDRVRVIDGSFAVTHTGKHIFGVDFQKRYNLYLVGTGYDLPTEGDEPLPGEYAGAEQAIIFDADTKEVIYHLLSLVKPYL